MVELSEITQPSMLTVKFSYKCTYLAGPTTSSYFSAFNSKKFISISFFKFLIDMPPNLGVGRDHWALQVHVAVYRQRSSEIEYRICKLCHQGEA